MPQVHHRKTKRQQGQKKDSVPNILNLPDWDIFATQENRDDYLFSAQYTKPTVSCPQCNTMFPRLKRFGTRQQLFLDLPIHAKRVGILVHHQRYLCQECRRTFIQPLPDMHDSRRATKRLVDYVEQESLKRTFSSIASDVGLTEGAIRLIFQDYIPRLERHLKTNIAPRWLGMDEITIVGKPRGVITNIEKQTVVELLDR